MISVSYVASFNFPKLLDIVEANKMHVGLVANNKNVYNVAWVSNSMCIQLFVSFC